jgi:hypothetical protein
LTEFLKLGGNLSGSRESKLLLGDIAGIWVTDRWCVIGSCEGLETLPAWRQGMFHRKVDNMAAFLSLVWYTRLHQSEMLMGENAS